jgi:hypothetical protein
MAQRKCPWCGRKIIGHPNKKFCNADHRHKHWNWARRKAQGDEYEGPYDPDDTHPFSSEGLGQW